MDVTSATGTTTVPADTVDSAKATEPGVDDLQDYIAAETGLNRETVADQARQQQADIPFLSPVAAHYLVAREHGLSAANHFRTEQDLALDIENLQPKMNDVELKASVTDRFLHNPDEEDWRFLKVTLQDDTGTIELMLWNEQIDEYDDTLTENARIRVVSGCTDTYNGDLQVKLGDSASIQQVAE
jgi:DNA polymerase III alpha subunit